MIKNNSCQLFLKNFLKKMPVFHEHVQIFIIGLIFSQNTLSCYQKLNKNKEIKN